MKLILKNLKQVTYNIEIPSEKSTVLELKKEIGKVHGFDETQVKLLFEGKLLDDAKTLEDYKIKEESVVIMMISKVKPKNVNGPSVTSSSSEKKTENKKEEIKKDDKTPQNKKAEEKKYTEQIKSLIDMGFEKSQAESAIKAAKGQIDKAIDFLYNGIPAGIKENDLEQGREQPSQGQAQGQEQQQGEGGNQEEADDDPVKTVASVAKVLCKNDPSSLTLLLQHIQQSDPDLMNLIKQREEEFKNFLEEPINENDYRVLQNYQQRMGLGGLGVRQGSGSGQRQVRLNLTPQDREAIERLKALGDFNEAEVIQAYIACDKNEELTANYLFEQKMRDDANGNGQ